MTDPINEPKPKRTWRQWVDAHFFAIWAVFTLLCVLATGISVALIVRHNFAQSELRACKRLNIERVRNNRNWAGTYKGDKASLAYDETFEELIVAGLKHQTNNVQRTPAQKKATELFVMRLNTQGQRLRESVTTLEWTPLTNCHDAVYTSKPSPEPVRFSEHEAPSSALKLAAVNE